MKNLLLASILLIAYSLPSSAVELSADALVSPANLYIQAQEEPSQAEAAVVPTEGDQLQLEYIDQYDHMLFTLGELDVERKITLNGGGKALETGAFELGFHIAVNYTP